MDAPRFPIVEASAKPSGSEFGFRGKDDQDRIDLLAFLFLYPEEAPLTGEKCRDAILRHEKEENPGLVLQSKSNFPSREGALAVAEYSADSPRGKWFMVRAFAATEDLCADIEFSSQHEISEATPAVKEGLGSVSFEPESKQDFQGLFSYATVLFRHEMTKQAAPVYEQALSVLPADDVSGKWRRAATDQAVMAYGMSGDLAKARALANRAIQGDPEYPLNYYNLACADAEEGNAAQAKIHLQEAFDRRKNTLPGESLPDPTQDDSIVKLKSDRAFWNFVENLQKNR
ncbi:MAG: tetratricopeptide repeat protein [Acidobacteriaceae bacterium]